MVLGARQAGVARGGGDGPRLRCSAWCCLVLPAVLQSAGNQSLGLIEYTPFFPGLFDLRGVAFAAWTLAAFAIGALAGMLIRRVVPAIAATLAVYAGLAFAAGGVLREHYLTPLVTSA